MAGQTGQNPDHLTSNPPALPPLLEELQAGPGAFALPQAVDIAGRWLRANGVRDAFRYRVNPSLSFPPGDIAAVTCAVKEDMRPHVRMVLNLMGLHGAGSPLPAYFTEHVAQHADERDAVRDFFDLFNHRLVELLYETWKKYRYYAQYQAHAADRLSGRFFGFIGVGHASLRKAKRLHWPRLMAYMGLIAVNSESAGSMESILRHYFGHEAISLAPCIARWVPIPFDQQTMLGERNDRLGEGFILGDAVEDQTGKFRVLVSDLTWAQFTSFLPSGDKFDELQTLTKFILKSRLDFDVELRLKPDEIRPWILKSEGEHRLGWSTWSGDGGDGVVVLETEHWEL